MQQAGNTDAQWLQLLQNGELDEQALKHSVSKNLSNPLVDLPPIAQLVGWLIVSHHRLPQLFEQKQRDLRDGEAKLNLNAMLKSITAAWGYQNPNDDAKRLAACFEFPDGLLSESAPWLKQLKKWSGKLLQLQPQIQPLLENGGYRLLLHHARLCLMLGDHYYSSCQKDANWKPMINLYANTDHQGLKQKLDEHLVKVSDQALKISQNLSRFSVEMDWAYDIKNLKKKSPAGYEWQDKAVDSIIQFKSQHEVYQQQGYGWFIVNMASTGCGKTVANAKIMRALSHDGDSLRFILALGLRTLTLQTGDEYRGRIGLKSDELAVLIGSSVIKELHEQVVRQAKQDPGFEELGSESLEMLLDEDLDYADAPIADFMEVLFPKHNAKLAEKHKAFLYKPVLACTIDHVIAATETLRGGKYILPCLRLLSSDLVIDEVDDFDGTDLIAIGRLIHLAGMLGRKVMISSATIPPALAEGFFNAYQEGWCLHSHFQQAHPLIASAWIDEFGAQVTRIDNADSLNRCQQYQALHKQFIRKRIKNLQQQVVKRKAFIVRCAEILEEKTEQHTKQQRYFDLLQITASQLHQHHFTLDTKTGKKVSFGVIRMANIPPCVALTQHLLQVDWGENVLPKIMAYHSRQVLLLRHEQEKHLDQVLKRTKSNPNHAIDHPHIRKILNATEAENVIFIVVATPVEEVGRDHDFDWAIIEPSSYRSIIQLAGRVMRHRQLLKDITQPNIAVMQYNLKGLRQGNGPAYYRPGYENAKSLKLVTHDLCTLVDETALNQAVNAIPRIQQPETLRPKEQLVDLEHHALSQCLTAYDKKGPQCLQAWFQEHWWLTALPQQIHRFRDSSPDTTLYLVWQGDKAVFHAKDEQGQFIPHQERSNINTLKPMNAVMLSRLWLDRNYADLLRAQAEREHHQYASDVERTMTQISERYGEITIQRQGKNEDSKWFYSDQLGLFKALS